MARILHTAWVPPIIPQIRWLINRRLYGTYPTDFSDVYGREEGGLSRRKECQATAMPMIN